MNKKIDIIKICIISISLIVFIASLTKTAFTFNDFDGQKTHSSLELLFLGSFVVLGGGLLEWIIWLANPLYILGIVKFLKGDKVCMAVSILATLLALSFTTWKEVLACESGRTAEIESLNSGYWLWVISLIILTIGTIFYHGKEWIKNKNTKTANNS
jgi:hypothetical protein